MELKTEIPSMFPYLSIKNKKTCGYLYTKGDAQGDH
jgi:hypothetical protein